MLENAIARAANLRAGFVYVISNIGAFGDGVLKIGLTRRLEPYERIRELHNASVPFRFDVHAVVFSDDAVGLEDCASSRLRRQARQFERTRTRSSSSSNARSGESCDRDLPRRPSVVRRRS